MLIRRRPSVATFVAVLFTLVVGTQTGLAASSSQKDHNAPDAVESVDLVDTDSTSITISWPPSPDNDAVAYGIYVNGSQVGWQAPDRVRRWKDKPSLQYTIRDLKCGTGYTVGVDAVDRSRNHSEMTTTTVSTSACPDSTPPTAPTAMRQVASTETSVILAWTPSTDNVGVVEYGLYASGVRVSTVSDANATVTSLECGKSYLLAIDAADAAGNRSTQSTSFFRTSACPSTNKPPTTPTGLKVTGASATGVTLAWSPSTDDTAVAGYGLYVSGQRTSHTTSTTASFTGLQCGSTYSLGVDAYDGPGLRSTVAQLSAATSPCAPPPPPTGATLTQTIADGSTVSGTVNWRAVYDSNGDKTPDDPGSMRFLVDGKVVLTEQNMPFGDTPGFWSSSSVGNGKHTFEVRAVDGAGTVVATKSVSASVANTAPSGGGDTSAPAVAATAPTNGSTVSGMMTQSVTATDNVGVTKVEFLRDGTVYGQDTTAPYSTSMNTTSLSNGSHTFGARAYDSAGNTGTAANVTVNVANAAADTTAPSTPGNLRVASANGTSVTIAWNAATDNVGVAGYGLYRGSTQTGQTQQATATYTGLTCGTAYQVGVDAYDTAGNRSSRADLAVATSACADNQAPTAPTNVIASTRTSTSIALTWGASSDNVGVAGYGVYNGADLVNTTTGTTGIVGGLVCGTNYTLAVDAFDATGNSSAKTVVMVSTLACADTAAPAVTVAAPTNGSTVSGTITETASATDNVGVTKVEFLRDGTVYGQDTTAPYSASFNTTTVTNGSHTFGARAYDSAGNMGTAANVTATVSNAAADTVAPTVTATAPTNGSTVSGTITETVNATDNVGVTKVEFLRDGVMYGTDTTSPYSASVDTTTVSNGSHTFGARAYDAAGNTGTAANITVTVSNNAPSTACSSSTSHVPGGPDGTGGCWPGPNNTGPTAPESSMSAYTGPCNVTTANTVIDSKVINCDITVGASGLVIKNSYIYGAVHGDGPAFTIQDSIVNGITGGFACINCGVDNDNFTILRTEIVNTNRGAYCSSNCLIQDSWIHGTTLEPVASNLAHASAVRVEQYTTLKHNTLACDYAGPFPNSEIGCSADISGYPDFAPIHHNTIDGNLLVANNIGIGMCVYGGGTSGKPYSGDPTNATYVVFQNNVFQRGANGKCGAYGAVNAFIAGRTGNVWSNNRWDNGAVVNSDN